MEKLQQLLAELINDKLVRITISASRDKNFASKVTVRPVLHKRQRMFQETLYRDKQVFHKTFDAQGLQAALLELMNGLFGQMEIDCEGLHVTVLVSKKGTVTIKKKQMTTVLTPPALSHNRKKKYILEEGRPVDFLVGLGVMTVEGKIVNSKYDKFRQINRFLEFIEDILPQLPKDRELTILDFGCGKSYLTFAMYYYLKKLRGYDLRIIGLDLKTDVIEHCNMLAEKYGYEKLKFLQGDIAQYEGVSQVDMVVTLHACDTATDYALAKAVGWNAKVILSVPCCQHQMHNEMECALLTPVFRYGIVQERTAALFTDGMRAELLRQQGYRTQLLEFIDMEHTPKNILIRAVRTGEPYKEQEAYDRLRAFLGTEPLLGRLLAETKQAEGTQQMRAGVRESNAHAQQQMTEGKKTANGKQGTDGKEIQS